MGYEDGEDLRSFKVGNINHVPNEWILTGSSLSNSVYMYLYKYIYIYIYIHIYIYVCVCVCGTRCVSNLDGYEPRRFCQTDMLLIMSSLRNIGR